MSIKAANNTEVSRSAATTATGAWVMAHRAMPQLPSEASVHVDAGDCGGMCAKAPGLPVRPPLQGRANAGLGAAHLTAFGNEKQPKEVMGL